MDSFFVFIFNGLHQTTLPAYIFIRLWQIIYISIFFNTLPPTPRFRPACSPFSDGLNRCAAKTACAALERHSPQRVRHGGASGNLCAATRTVWFFVRAEAVLSDGLSVGRASMLDIFQFAGARQSGMNARPTRFQTASSAANAPVPPETARQTAAGLYYNPPLPYPRTQQCIL